MHGLPIRLQHIIGFKLARRPFALRPQRPVFQRIDVEYEYAAWPQDALHILHEGAGQRIAKHMDGHVRHDRIKAGGWKRQASRYICEDETRRRAGFGSRVGEGCLEVIETHNSQTEMGEAPHIIAAAAAEIEERSDTICV